MVSSHRRFDGSLPLAVMGRLRSSLHDTHGKCRFTLEFGRDALKIAYLQLTLEATLPLQCQRTLERFELPVRIEQRLGLVRNEAQEAALPEDYEPVLVEDDGALHPLELIEDELILALPVVPLRPDSDAVDIVWPVQAPEMEDAPPNPFAALVTLKQNKP